MEVTAVSWPYNGSMRERMVKLGFVSEAQLGEMAEGWNKSTDVKMGEHQ